MKVRMLLAFTALLYAQPAWSSPPNILVILVDDLRADSLGAAGHPFSQTPNIDRLAREGTLFANAIVASPLCSPSRASLLTGQFPTRHGILENNQNGGGSDSALRTWPAALQEAGYRTAFVGKWHMDFTAAPRVGFDRWVSFDQQGSHLDPVFNVDGEETALSGFTTDLLTDHAVDFLEDDPGDRPFAMVLAFKAVHGPFPLDNSNVPERFRGLYADATVEPTPNAQTGYTLEGKPALQYPPEGFDPPIPGETGIREGLAENQLRMLAHIDEQVGRLLATLTAMGELDETVIVFCSDSGYFWGEHGLTAKLSPYEPGIRIPLIVRFPTLVPPATVAHGVVSSADVAPTVLEIAGQPLPPGVQGRSLLPAFSEPEEEVQEAVYAEYFDANPNDVYWYPSWQAVRTRHLKYVHYPDLTESADELYDISVDPHETANLIGDPGYAEELGHLKVVLRRKTRGLRRRAREVAVTGSEHDYAITESGTTQPGGGIAIAGSDDRFPAGGRNAVLVFELPVLQTEDRILSAQVDYRIYVGETHPPAPTVHADLWLLKIGDASPEIAYLEADADPDPSHVKLSDDAIWWDRASNWISTEPFASRRLAEILAGFYGQHPQYAGGAFLHLRFNPDGDTGTSRRGWTLLTAEHSEPAFHPRLVLDIETTCMDGLDNDDDGLVDFDGGVWVHGVCVDGSCPSGVSDTELDGTPDADPDCSGASRDEQPTGCGLGAELALILATASWLRRRSRTR